MLLCVIADGIAVLPFSYVTAINVLKMNFILFNITELVFCKLPNCFLVFRIQVVSNSSPLCVNITADHFCTVFLSLKKKIVFFFLEIKSQECELFFGGEFFPYDTLWRERSFTYDTF